MSTNFVITTPQMGIVDLSSVIVSPLVGTPWIGTTNALPSFTPENTVGQIVTAYDTTANASSTGAGGGGSFILLRVPTSTTVTAGLVYRWNAATYDIVVMPTSLGTQALSGAPMAVAVVSVASNASAVQYTWMQVQGRCTVLKTAVQVLPDLPIYILGATAGRVKVLGSAFRGIIGARTANVATVTSTTSTVAVYLNFPSVTAGI